jgi:membrane-associated phospholipid phosphatase
MRRIIVPVIVIYAVFVCLSRIYDRWHHPTDVLGGSILGRFADAVLTYYFYTF